MPGPAPAAPDRDAVLEIRVLGPLIVLVDGSPLVVDTRKALALLVLLAVERRAYARDEVAALLWPEADGESARGALRRTLSVLRAALGGRWLAVSRSAVDLERNGLVADLDLVEAALADGGLAALRAAADLARGPFLAGFTLRDSAEFDDWRATRASQAERIVGEVLDRLATAAAGTGDYTLATRMASRRVDLDPLDEGAHRRLIRTFAEAGDRDAAIRQYRVLVATLERELGVPPLAETTALYEAVREGRVAPRPAAPPAPSRADETSSRTVAVPAPKARPAVLPLIARDEALHRLAAVHAAASPDGRLAVITGEAGIGKTRLAEELEARVAAASGRVVAATANVAEAGIPYAPLLDLLRAGLTLPEAEARLGRLPAWTLAELDRLVALPSRLAASGPAALGPDSPAARARLLEALATGIAALVDGPVPGLVRLDDAQWADETTLEAVLYLARRLGSRSMLLVVSWRPEDLDGAAVGFADRLAAADPLLVRLERLTLADVEGLVAAVGSPVDAAALYGASEGLPLYLAEALAASPGTQTLGIRALLRQRLSRVGETAGQVLSAAAVIGRSFDLPTVRAAAGRTEDETIAALEELVRRGLVRERAGPGEPAWDFPHERLRAAAYDATSLARRRLLHRRVADTLRERAVHDADPARLSLVGRHELAAGREAEAAIAFREAGYRARALYAHPEAIEAFEAALALGHPDVSGLQAALGESRAAIGEYAAAVASLEAAAALAQPDELPAAELRLGRVHARRGDLAAAASHLDSALASLGDPAGRPLARQALAERSLVAVRAGDPALASALGTRLLAAAEVASDRGAIGAALRMLGLVERQSGDFQAARDALVRSLELADGDHDPGAGIAARNALALVEGDLGRDEAAIALLGPALDGCRLTGERHLEAAIEGNLADRLHALGRTDEAMEHLKRAAAILGDLGGRPDALDPEVWKLAVW